MTESEIERLRAQVDTLTRERDELRHIKAQFVALTDDGGSVDVTSFMVELHARAESAEAAAGTDVMTLARQREEANRRAESAEARIEAAIALANEALDVGDVWSGLRRIRAALEPVGEPQPEGNET